MTPFYGYTCDQCNARKLNKHNRFLSFNYGMTVETSTLEVKWLQGSSLSAGGNLSKVRNIGFFEIGILFLDAGGSFFYHYGYDFTKSQTFNFGVYGGPLLGAKYLKPEESDKKTINKSVDGFFLPEPVFGTWSLSFGGDAGIFVETFLNSSGSVSLLGHIGLRYTTFFKEPAWNKDDLLAYLNVGVRWNF